MVVIMSPLSGGDLKDKVPVRSIGQAIANSVSSKQLFGNVNASLWLHCYPTIPPSMGLSNIYLFFNLGNLNFSQSEEKIREGSIKYFFSLQDWSGFFLFF